MAFGDVEFDVPLRLLNKQFDMWVSIAEIRSGLEFWQSLAYMYMVFEDLGMVTTPSV